MQTNRETITAAPVSHGPSDCSLPPAMLTEEERKVRDDYEFALHDGSVRQRYGGQVVIVHRRKILGAGKTHRDAWTAAQSDPSCPSKQHVAMVVVPENTRP